MFMDKFAHILGEFSPESILQDAREREERKEQAENNAPRGFSFSHLGADGLPVYLKTRKGREFRKTTWKKRVEKPFSMEEKAESLGHEGFGVRVKTPAFAPLLSHAQRLWGMKGVTRKPFSLFRLTSRKGSGKGYLVSYEKYCKTDERGKVFPLICGNYTKAKLARMQDVTIRKMHLKGSLFFSSSLPHHSFPF